jgi:hypothetical protein
MLNAALGGFGLAYVPEDLARPQVVRVASNECSRIGALRFRVTISITQAIVNRPLCLRCSSKRSGTAGPERFAQFHRRP